MSWAKNIYSGRGSLLLPIFAVSVELSTLVVGAEGTSERPVAFDLRFDFEGTRMSGACQGALVGKREVEVGVCKRLAPESGDSCCLAAIATAGHCVSQFISGSKREFSSVSLTFPGGDVALEVLNEPGRLSYQFGGTADVAAIRFPVPCNFLAGLRPAKIAQTDAEGRALIGEKDLISARKRNSPIGLNRGGGDWLDAYFWKFDPGQGPGHTGASGMLSKDGRIVGGDSGGPVINKQTGEWIAPIASVPDAKRDLDGNDVGYSPRFYFDAHAAGFMRTVLQKWGLDGEKPREVAENRRHVLETTTHNDEGNNQPSRRTAP